MPRISFLFIPFLLISFLLTACNLPGGPTPASTPTVDVLATMVAATLQALSPTPAPPTSTPTPPLPTLPVTATPTQTPTFAAAGLTISRDTNCRSGPGQGYDVLTVFRAGAQAEIVGKLKEGGWWVLKLPTGGECWLWGEFATPTGGFDGAPERTPPPTPTPAPPAAPRGLTYGFACSFGSVTTDLTWLDIAVNEEGYRVFRNNEKVADLPANASAYTDVHSVTGASTGLTLTYRVEAFNSSGVGEASITFTCP